MDFAAALVTAGVLLIAAEFCRPGWVWPGVLGAVTVVWGGYQLPLAPFAELLLCVALAVAAGGLRWPRWTAAVAGASAIAVSAQLGVHWLTALSAALPSLVLFWLMTVAARALANKTIVG